MHFSYDGKTEVIKGVSLEIQPGQTVAFVGLSYYSSSDSVDFTQPREFRVYSVGGAYYRFSIIWQAVSEYLISEIRRSQ